MIIRSMVVMSLAFLLGACSKPVTQYLSQPVQATLGPVEAIIVARQDTPSVTVSLTNPAALGGLTGMIIGGVVDVVRSANAQGEAAPINNALQGFDFRAELLAATTARITNLPNINVTVRPTVETIGTVAAAKAAYDDSTASAVLFFTVNYALVSGDFVLTASARMYPKTAALEAFRPSPAKNPMEPGNAIYENKFRVEKPSITPRNVRSKLLEALNELAAQLAADLNTSK